MVFTVLHAFSVFRVSRVLYHGSHFGVIAVCFGHLLRLHCVCSAFGAALAVQACVAVLFRTSGHCGAAGFRGGHGLRASLTAHFRAGAMRCMGLTDSHIRSVICREKSAGGSGCTLERAVVWAARRRPIWQPRSGSISTNFRHCL